MQVDGKTEGLAGVDVQELIEIATKARESAYAPYSKYQVGAALLTKAGRIYAGCNIEFASWGVTSCAERTALVKAISEGERDFAAIAVVTDSPVPGTPCGICRQALVEFAPELPVITANLGGVCHIRPLSHLLAEPFTRAAMEKA